MNQHRETVLLVALTALAAGLWFVTFGLTEWGNFWVKISVSAGILAILSLIAFGGERAQNFEFKQRHLWLGIGSAALLYGFFALGDFILRSLFPGFAPSEIDAVYARKEGTDAIWIALLLVLVTSPSEEIFWRGFLQRLLIRRIGPMAGLIVATAIYALVHIWTMNLSLMLAAFTAGLVWGWLYSSERTLVPVIISHALWTVTIFILLPLH
jgi:hypothetical protein